MDNARHMRRVERLRNLAPQCQQRLHLNRTPGNAVFQRRTFQELHHQERAAVLLANIVDRANIRMIERGCSAGLPLETAEYLGISRHVIRQKLESDETA